MQKIMGTKSSDTSTIMRNSSPKYVRREELHTIVLVSLILLPRELLVYMIFGIMIMHPKEDAEIAVLPIFIPHS